MKRKNIFGGLLFILGAVLIITSSMGLLHGLGFWSILFTIGFVALLGDGIFHFDIGKILFSIAFLIIIHDERLGLEALTPWPVLGAALLGTIGLHMIFPNIKKKFKHSYVEIPESTEISPVSEETAEQGETADFSTIFSNSVKYIHNSALQHIAMECIFGNLTVYFDQAALENHFARVNVDTIFGQTRLFIPHDWNVIIKSDTVFGSARENGSCNRNGENTLEINGDVVFGRLEIHYI